MTLFSSSIFYNFFANNENIIHITNKKNLSNFNIKWNI